MLPVNVNKSKDAFVDLNYCFCSTRKINFTPKRYYAL